MGCDWGVGGARILIAEDSDLQSAALAEVLRDEGYQVVAAGDGEAAWELLRAEDFALLVADGRMPLLDGYQLCVRIRADPRLADLPVVLVTVYDELANALRGLEVGADLFLAKPVARDLLLERVRRLLEQPRRAPRPAGAPGITTWFQGRLVEVPSDPSRALDYLACALEDVVHARQAEHGERRRATEAQAAREFYQDILEALPQEVAVLDDRGRVVASNHRFSGSALGGAEEGVLETLRVAPEGSPRRDLGEGLAEVLARRQDSFQMEHRGAGVAADRWFQVRVGRLEHEGPGRVVLVREDITSRRRIEAQVQLSQRMEAMGSLTAGVAHEINNPLAYVLGHLETLQEELEQEGALFPGRQEHLEAALEGVLRIRELVSKLRVFSQGDRPGAGPVPVDLVPVIQGAVQLASNETRYRARLELDLPPEVPPVLGLPGELGQVVLHLLLNAAHAIAPGAVGDHRIRVALGQHEESVLLEVEDDGEGIAPEILGRIFDPFFTTRAPGTGTGLGLSVCEGIVRRMGGNITVRSTPGVGSCFTVTLPAGTPGEVASGAAAAVAAAAGPGGGPEAAGAPPRRGRVLVVDDEPRLLDVLQRLLQSEHDVFMAGSGRRAKEILSRDRDFDLVLCDLMMPDVTGMDLLDWIRAEHPGLEARLAFMTGGALDERTRRFRDEHQGAVLTKPFMRGALLDLVRSHLR